MTKPDGRFDGTRGGGNDSTACDALNDECMPETVVATKLNRLVACVDGRTQRRELMVDPRIPSRLSGC